MPKENLNQLTKSLVDQATRETPVLTPSLAAE
jgi:hypothetical protein